MELVAVKCSGYEWECPHCTTFNVVSVKPDAEVQCSSCMHKFAPEFEEEVDA